MIADLHDFEIYLSPDGFKARSYELLGLHHLEVPRSKKMLFDGLLCIGGIKHYVEGIPVRDYSIEGYGDSDEPTTATYIQSALGGKDPAHDIWYRLNKPTKAYARHHDPFLWVAQLAKHVLDYLDEQPRASVGLEHFRSKFQQWLATRFLAHKAFNVWYHAITDRGDFRICVNAYIEFLYQQAYNLPNSENLLAHPLWADCMAGGLSQVVVQERIVQDTLATPDVYDCFKHMYFSGVIRSMPLSPDVKARQQRRMSEMGFQSATEAHLERTPKGHAYGRFPVQVGDVVAFDPDKADKQKWRNADWEWLLYVTDIQLLRTGVQQLFGLYLYRPRETDIFIAQYRYQNELFFSDNCNCDDGALLSTDIKGRYDIQWTPATMPSDAFFVRQTYITEESSFVTFVEKHKICECKKQRPSKANRFRRGDTVYITITVDGRTILEPVIIHQVEEASAGFTVRRFARLSRDLAEQANHVRKSTIAINELVLTDKYEKVIMTRIQRQCHIRFVLKSDVLMNRIPSPYNRKGAGDCWFFSMGLSVKDGTSSIEFLARAPNYVKQGCLPEASDKRLRGMSLFSGGGNLDRGVEEGGVVDVRTVVEWDAAAIHTQRANAQDVTTQQLFCGSVDEHLKLAIDGSASRLVPRIGDVNITIAGSPCPGT
jgi:DNA (cytosine-5)-methyltransferase 1